MKSQGDKKKSAAEKPKKAKEVKKGYSALAEETKIKTSLANELKEENKMPELPTSEATLNLQTVMLGKDSGLLHVSVVPQAEGPLKPSLIVCLIDVSGSMGDHAKDANTGESDGFSILDFVKHSLKTIINTMNPADYLALVEFQSTSKAIFPISQMDEAGKKASTDAVNSLHHTGGTNLKLGIETALNLIIDSPICKEINTSLWVFTDGQPDNAAVVVPAMNELLKGRSPPCVINTFGFGYNLNSDLLYNMAEMGNGIFCYVPDCNFLGTTFVNCMSNTIVSTLYKTYLRVSSEDCKNFKCIGTQLKDGKYEIGTVQYGQSRDLVFMFDTIPDKKPKFTVQLKCNAGITKKEIVGIEATNPNAAYRAYSRGKFQNIVYEGVKKLQNGGNDLKFLAEAQDLIKSLPSKDDNEMKAMLRDFESPVETEGRITKAVSTQERIQRWGLHYILSLLRGHKLQQAHNFKDPGVQVYGGKLFKEIQLKADKIFCTLPPPTPSLAPIKNAPVDPSAPPAPVSMDAYMDSASCGCFSGDAVAKLSCGKYVKVKDLKKGDEIESLGKTAKIVCIVEFPMKCQTPLVNLNGMLITPKHPILFEGNWVYPKSISAAKSLYIESVFNLVLDKNHSANLNGIEVVTLGHEKYDNEVVKHEYYGTQRVIRDLQNIEGFSSGFVDMSKCKKYCDPFTGKVVCFN